MPRLGLAEIFPDPDHKDLVCCRAAEDGHVFQAGDTSYKWNLLRESDWNHKHFFADDCYSLTTGFTPPARLSDYFNYPFGKRTQIRPFRIALGGGRDFKQKEPIVLPVDITFLCEGASATLLDTDHGNALWGMRCILPDGTQNVTPIDRPILRNSPDLKTHFLTDRKSYQRSLDLSAMADFSKPGTYRVQLVYDSFSIADTEKGDYWVGSFRSPVFEIKISPSTAPGEAKAGDGKAAAVPASEAAPLAITEKEYEKVRLPRSANNEKAELMVAPSTDRKAGQTLNDWCEAIRKAPAPPALTSSEDTWLLFRSDRLSSLDSLRIGRAERKGDRIAVVAQCALYTGVYAQNEMWHADFGLNLGKLPAGDYRVEWVIEIEYETLDDKGVPKRLERSVEDIAPKRLELKFTVGGRPAAGAAPAGSPQAGSAPVPLSAEQRAEIARRVADALDKAVAERAEDAAALAKLPFEEGIPMREFSGGVRYLPTAIQQFGVGPDPKYKAACAVAAAQHLDDKRPPYRAMACELLSFSFPYENDRGGPASPRRALVGRLGADLPEVDPYFRRASGRKFHPAAAGRRLRVGRRKSSLGVRHGLQFRRLQDVRTSGGGGTATRITAFGTGQPAGGCCSETR